LKKKPSFLTILLIVLIVLGCTLGGCVAGFMVGSVPTNPAAVRWQPLPDPPEKPVKIVEIGGYGKDPHSLYINAASGKQYECCAPWPFVWKEVAAKRYGQTVSCPQPQTKPFDELPGVAIDCAYAMQWEWATERHYVALLEDGSLWRWRYYQGMSNMFDSVAWGSGVGVVSGIIIAIIVTRRRKE
jgi:hypothetical protein